MEEDGGGQRERVTGMGSQMETSCRPSATRLKARWFGGVAT